MIRKAVTSDSTGVIVHAALGTYGGPDNKHFAPIPIRDKYNARNVFFALKGVTTAHIYNPLAPSLPAPPRPPTKPISSSPVKFKPGDRVLAKFEASRIYFKGFIHQLNGIGTFHVKFDDGDEDLSVPPTFMKHGSKETFKVTNHKSLSLFD